MLVKPKKKFWIPSVAPLYAAPAGGGATPSLTSSASGAAGAGTVTVPNVAAGDVVVLCMIGYGHVTPPAGVASSPSLGSFNGPVFDGVQQGQIMWAYNSGGALTNELITFTRANSAKAMSIAGANTSSPFDSGGFFGAGDASSGSAQNIQLSITTAHAKAMIITQAGSPTSAMTSPWVNLGGSAYGEITEYQIVTATGTYTVFAGQTPVGGCSYLFAVKGS